MDSRAPLPKPAVTLKAQLHRVCGVDLTKIPGIKEQAAQVIISEVGLDMTKWNTEKQFSSFLGLCPDNSVSGGKVLRRATRKVYNRAADVLRLCAPFRYSRAHYVSQILTGVLCVHDPRRLCFSRTLNPEITIRYPACVLAHLPQRYRPHISARRLKRLVERMDGLIIAAGFPVLADRFDQSPQSLLAG
jgi:Transposase IS116/IS110/IS902 family